MKAQLVRLAILSTATALFSQAATAQDGTAKTKDVVAVLEGSRLVVDTPSSNGYPHLVKTYTHVSSNGCELKYVETADESGKLVDGKPEGRHSTYAFTVNLAQATGPAKDPLVRGQKSDHLYYSVPLAYQAEQTIVQEVSVNGVQTTSAVLKHTSASFEVEGQEHAAKLQSALNAAIQACSAK